MNRIHSVDTNVIVWSILKGDHGCKDTIECLADRLINKPDLMSAAENDLRLCALFHGHGRQAVAKLLRERQFDLVTLDIPDLESAMTPFGGNLADFVCAYERARVADGPIHENVALNIPAKSIGDVQRLFQGLRAACARGLPAVSGNWIHDPSESLDFYRSVWIQAPNGQWMLIDGTHRAVALLWQHRFHGGLNLIHPLYGFAQRL